MPRNDPQAGFIFGGDTGLTLEELQRRREIAQRLLRRGGGGRRARTLGEGLASFGKSIGSALIDRSFDARERAARERALRTNLSQLDIG